MLLLTLFIIKTFFFGLQPTETFDFITWPGYAKSLQLIMVYYVAIVDAQLHNVCNDSMQFQ